MISEYSSSVSIEEFDVAKATWVRNADSGESCCSSIDPTEDDSLMSTIDAEGLEVALIVVP